MELVTGFQGKNHVTAKQIADFNRGIFGNAAILPVGSKMAVEIQTANRITVKDGVAVFDGREVYIGYGKNETVNLTSGTQGMKRHDIVVVEYKKENESGVESVALKVLPGTPSSTAPKDPAVNDVDIRTGTIYSEKPFCRVRLNGTAIEGIDMLVEVKEFKKHTFADPVKSLTEAKEGYALDAVMGKALENEIVEVDERAMNKYASDIGNPPSINYSYFVNATSMIPIGDITIPQYSKGVFMTNGGSDGCLLMVDAGCNLYVGFRNGGKWTGRKI